MKILRVWKPRSLAKNVEVILIPKSMNSEIRTTSSLFLLAEVILISEFMNSGMSITSTYRLTDCQGFISKNLYYLCSNTLCIRTVM